MRLIDADVLKYALGSSDEAIYFDALIDEMPTIEPQINDWTPCAEGLPEFTNFYNVTVGVGGMLGYYEETRTYRYLKIKGEEPKWVIPDRFDEVVHVLAWQPLPAPYNPDHIRDTTKKVED